MSKTKDNIVLFPNLKKGTPPQNLEEYAERAAEYSRKYSQNFCEKISKIVFAEMARDGIDFENRSDELMPNSVLVMESILSLHMKASGLIHPLQEFAEEAFDEMDINFEDDGSEDEETS